MIDEVGTDEGPGPFPSFPSTEIGDFVGFGRAVEQLIKHVAKATGILYRPKAIRDQAKALADAKRLEVDAKAYEIVRLAQAKSEATEIKDESLLTQKEKAITKIRTKAVWRENNFDKIIDQAARKIGDQDSAPFQSEDWLMRFIDYAQDVSDEKLQTIWSEILARKMVSTRRSVSLLTLDTVRLLEPRQAILFDEVVRVIASIGLSYRKISKDKQVQIDDDLRILSELRLIDINKNEPPEGESAILYFQKRFSLHVTKANRGTRHPWLQDIALTFRGEELARIVLAVPKEEENLNITSVCDNPSNHYRYLSVEQQTAFIKGMLKYLWSSNYDCMIGGATGSYPPPITHRWNGEFLEGTGEEPTGRLPPELNALVDTG